MKRLVRLEWDRSLNEFEENEVLRVLCKLDRNGELLDYCESDSLQPAIINTALTLGEIEHFVKTNLDNHDTGFVVADIFQSEALTKN